MEIVYADVTNIVYMMLALRFNLSFVERHTRQTRYFLNSIDCNSLPAFIVVTTKQGDLKRYLRAQRKSDGMTPDLPTRDLLTLQRMAFEITSGLLHLHENNYIHRSAIP